MTFHIKLEKGRNSFSRYWHPKFMPEKLIFRNITSVSKLYMAYRSPKSTCTFPHKYTQLRSLVLVLWETYNIFLFFTFSQKTDNVFWQSIKNKGYLTVNTFPNYAYVSSYFHFKSFAWKRDWTISEKWHKVRLWVGPFSKALTDFYKFH